MGNSDRFSHPSLGSARSGPRRDKSESSEMSARGAGGTSKTNSSTAGGKGNRKGSAAGAGAGQPSSGETTTESTSETETDSHPDRQPPSRPGTSGTLRSMQSVPIMTLLQGPFSPLMGGIYGVGMVGMMPPNTWNGEPCPVHGASLHPPSTISTTPPDGHGGISSIPTHVQQHVDAAGRIHPGDGHSSADASASAGHLQSHGPASRPQTAHGDGSSIVTGPGVVARGTRTDAADVSPAIRSSLSPPHASVFTPSAHAAEALGRQRQKRSSGSPAGARRSAAAH